MTTRSLTLTGLLVALAFPAAASAANTWEGVWNSDFGRMTISAGGSGSYEGFSPGTISGPANGNVNEGTWHQPGNPPKEGPYKFTLSGDGRSFSGVWAYKSGGCGTACGWNGTCIEGACLKNGTAPATPPPTPKPPPFEPVDAVPAPGTWCTGAASPGRVARIAQFASQAVPCATKTQPLAAGDSNIVPSPPLGKTQTEADVVVATEDDIKVRDSLSRLTTMLTKLPTKGKRLMLCIGMYQSLAEEDVKWPSVLDPSKLVSSGYVEYPPENQGAALVALSLCLRIAAIVNAGETPVARAAATGCGSSRLQIPVRFKGKSSKRRIGLRKAKRTKSNPLSVTCQRSGNTLTMRVRARKGTLRSIVGPRLNVGLQNQSQATAATTAAVAFIRR